MIINIHSHGTKMAADGTAGKSRKNCQDNALPRGPMGDSSLVDSVTWNPCFSNLVTDSGGL